MIRNNVLWAGILWMDGICEKYTLNDITLDDIKVFI